MASKPPQNEQIHSTEITMDLYESLRIEMLFRPHAANHSCNYIYVSWLATRTENNLSLEICVHQLLT